MMGQWLSTVTGESRGFLNSLAYGQAPCGLNEVDLQTNKSLVRSTEVSLEGSPSGLTEVDQHLTH